MARCVISISDARFRLLVHSLGGEGYLNFEGNEFGHPEVSLPTSTFLVPVHRLIISSVA